MSYTRGPWLTFNNEIIAEPDVVVADVPLRDGTNPTEWQDNMHLIAAAPELLAAAKLSLECLASYPGVAAFRAWHQTRIAIAKAEGRS